MLDFYGTVDMFKKNFLIINILLFASGDDLTLKMSNIAFRHGARAPTVFYPNYYNRDYWLDGAGALTQKGMRMEYDLGKFFKKRYIVDAGLLNSSYIESEIYIRSSGVDRCLQSAQSQLAGLYPPQGRQVWNPDIPWQPVPVHTVPLGEDPVLRPNDDYCPRRSELFKQKIESDEFSKFLAANKDFVKYLGEMSGLPARSNEEKEHVIHIIGSAYLCELPANLPPPDWLTEEQRKKLVELFHYVMWFRYTEDNDELGRLLGGTLLNNMIDNMNKRIKNKRRRTHKVVMYSTHDSTLAALCATLDIRLPEYFPFAAAIMIELYADRSSEMQPRLAKEEDRAELCHLEIINPNKPVHQSKSSKGKNMWR